MLVASAFFLLAPATATAAGTFNVDFQTTPLFSQLNIAPGDSVTRTIVVDNKDANLESFYMEALNSNNTGLGSALIFTVNNGGTQLYRGTLEDFFTVGKVQLGSVVAGATTTYAATVSFVDSSGNNYQNVSAGFDLCIGIVGGDTTCDESNSGGGGDDNGPNNGGGNNGISSFGGGSMSQLLRISDENGFAVPPTMGTITWRTNMSATTQVVYGSKLGEPYVLNLSATNFGYPNSTNEDSTLTTHHLVALSGLIPGATYDFRLVSRLNTGGMPTLSPEYKLVMPSRLAFAPFLNILGGTNGTGNRKENVSSGTPTTTIATTDGLAIGAKNNDAFAAAAALAGPFPWLKNNWFWFLLAFGIFALLFGALYGRTRRR